MLIIRRTHVNYNQVKRELIKRYPSTKKEFDKEQRKYEREFGK